MTSRSWLMGLTDRRGRQLLSVGPSATQPLQSSCRAIACNKTLIERETIMGGLLMAKAIIRSTSRSNQCCNRHRIANSPCTCIRLQGCKGHAVSQG